MAEQKKSKNSKKEKQKRKLLDIFLTREEPDQDFLPELKSQWKSMNKGERVKFIIGALIGLIIFVGGLILAYVILSALRL